MTLSPFVAKNGLIIKPLENDIGQLLSIGPSGDVITTGLVTSDVTGGGLDIPTADFRYVNASGDSMSGNYVLFDGIFGFGGEIGGSAGTPTNDPTNTRAQLTIDGTDGLFNIVDTNGNKSLQYGSSALNLHNTSVNNYILRFRDSSSEGGGGTSRGDSQAGIVTAEIQPSDGFAAFGSAINPSYQLYVDGDTRVEDNFEVADNLTIESLASNPDEIVTVNNAGQLQVSGFSISDISGTSISLIAGDGISIVESPSDIFTISVTGNYADQTTVDTISADLDTLESQVAGITGGVGQLDDRYVNITGDTMTGQLIIRNFEQTSNATELFHPALVIGNKNPTSTSYGFECFLGEASSTIPADIVVVPGFAGQDIKLGELQFNAAISGTSTIDDFRGLDLEFQIRSNGSRVTMDEAYGIKLYHRGQLIDADKFAALDIFLEYEPGNGIEPQANNAYGIRVTNNRRGGAVPPGNITNEYGVWINEPNTGDNAWSLYAEGRMETEGDMIVGLDLTVDDQITVNSFASSAANRIVIADSTGTLQLSDFTVADLTGGAITPNLSGSFTRTFTNADLVSGGLLDVNHNLNDDFVVPALWDNTGAFVQPDYTRINSNTTRLDISSFGAIPGTWGVKFVAAAGTGTTVISAGGGSNQVFIPGDGISIVESPVDVLTFSVTGDYALSSTVANLTGDLQNQISIIQSDVISVSGQVLDNDTDIVSLSAALDALQTQVDGISGELPIIRVVTTTETVSSQGPNEIFVIRPSGSDITLTIPDATNEGSGIQKRFVLDDATGGTVEIQVDGGDNIGDKMMQFIGQNSRGFSIISDDRPEWIIVQDSRRSQTFTFQSPEFDSPNNSDWAVNSLAPAESDAINPALTIRTFDDTTEEGIGVNFKLPEWASRVSVTSVSRATSGQTGDVSSQFYFRTLLESTTGDSLSSWSSAISASDISFTDGVGLWKFNEDNFILDDFGLGGVRTQVFLEYTRNSASLTDTLIGDWILFQLQFILE